MKIQPPVSAWSHAEWTVGRGEELTLFESLLADLGAHRGRTLWLEGEPGIGKSNLVDALLSRAGAKNFRVYRGRADELTQPFPLRPLADGLGISARSPDPRRKAISRLLGGASVDQEVLDPVLAGAEQIIDLLDQTCAEEPVLLVLEDLQWADAASLSVWSRLTRLVDALPLLLVGTSRPVPRRPELERLKETVDERGGVFRAIGALDQAAVVELAGRLLSARPGPRLAAELARAAGNPLYVRVLVDALRRDADLDLTGGVAELPADRESGSDSLTAAISRRLGFLDDATRGLLRLAALLGNEFTAQELTRVADRPAASLQTLLADALAAGVLAEAGDRLTFRHDLIRQTLRDEIPGSLRQALHNQIAQSLAQADAGIVAVARHLLAAGDAIDAWATAWAVGLPSAAFFIAPGVAVEVLNRIVPSIVDERLREILEARLATALFWLGDRRRAGEVATNLLRVAEDPEVRGRMRLYQLRAASQQARNEDALAFAAAAFAERDLPASWRARIRAWSAIVLIKLSRIDEGAEQARLAMAEGEQCDDPLAIGYAHHVLTHLVDSGTALDHISAAVAILNTDADSTELRVMLLSNRLAHLNNLGRRAEFALTVHETLAFSSRTGAGRAGRIQMHGAMGHYDFGSWDDSLFHVNSLRPPLTNAMLIVMHGLAALIAGHREDWSLLRSQVAAASAIPITSGDVRIYSGYLVAAQAMRAEADGDLTRAVALLSTWLGPDLGHDNQERYMWLPQLVRLSLAVGDQSTARAAADAARADAAEPQALIRQLVAADVCAAQLAGDAPGLLRAAEVYERHGWPMARCSALEEAAVRLAEAGDVAGARQVLNDAVRGYAEVNAPWDIRRADARLRAAGVRRGPRSLRRRPATGWDALTPAEQRVVELVAEGRSNADIAAQLFTSPRTVQTHVSHILAKLSLRSRLEIMRAAAVH